MRVALRPGLPGKPMLVDSHAWQEGCGEPGGTWSGVNGGGHGELG